MSMNSSLSGIEQQLDNSAAFNYTGWRKKFLLAVLRAASLAGIPLIAASFGSATPRDRVLFIGLYLVVVAFTVLPVSYNARAILLLSAVFLVGVNSIIAWGPWLDGSIFFISFITLTALLFDRPADYIALGLSIFTFVVVALLHQAGMISLSGASTITKTVIVDWVAYIADFVIPSLLILFAISQFKQEFAKIIGQVQETFNSLIKERTLLESRVAERTEMIELNASQLRASNNVAKVVAEIQDTGELMETVVRMIGQQFGYYHINLYILDERKRIAFLQAATNGADQAADQILKIEQDRRSAFNFVVTEKRHLLTSDLSPRFVHDRNHPLTRSRMLLPMRVRGNVIGILDLHSDQPQTFNQIDPDVLQSLADLVAIAIDNVRLINETKALLNQLERYTSTQTMETWAKQTSRNTPAYQYTPAGVRPLFSTSRQDDEGTARIPLKLQGQVIGSIKLRRKGAMAKWAERELNLVEKVAEQVSLALENSRLVEEAQKNAQRDQIIANISNRIRETLDIDSVIRTAAEELRKVFDLKEAEINIGAPQSQPDTPKRHTGMLRLR